MIFVTDAFGDFSCGQSLDYGGHSLEQFAIKVDRPGREGMTKEADAEKKSEVGFQYMRPP
jgi:hypothetical protein